MNTSEKNINNLFAIWDPIGVKRIEPGMEYDEYKSYANILSSGTVKNVKEYLIEIFTDMVDKPNLNQLIEIETITKHILLLLDNQL